MSLLSHPNHRHRRASLSIIDETTWAVLDDHDTLGYVHRAGIVFVSLRGGDLHHAVEVGQSLSLDRAVELVQAA